MRYLLIKRQGTPVACLHVPPGQTIKVPPGATAELLAPTPPEDNYQLPYGAAPRSEAYEQAH